MINMIDRAIGAVVYWTVYAVLTVAYRVQAAGANLAADARTLRRQLDVKTAPDRLARWALPNPHTTWTYTGRRRAGTSRRLRAVTQESDIQRIRRGLEAAGAVVLTGEIPKVAA